MAFHDSLTGLANRSLLYDRLNKGLSHAKRRDAGLALLLIDLDRFRAVNENLGRAAGDRLLKQVASSLNTVLRDTDTVARINNDQFVVILESITLIDDIAVIADKLLAAVAQPLVFQGLEVNCTASIGISLFPKNGCTADELLRNADIAMYRSKILGKSGYQFFLDIMTSQGGNGLLLESDLREAIERGELRLHYQPQINIVSRKVVGVEALVRWQHKEQGLLTPSLFIPLAEETGLIEPLGEWVLDEACQAFQRWLKQGIDFGRIAVNLSANQFQIEDFDQRVAHILESTGLPSKHLELELTESIAMENAAAAIEMLNRLHNMGLALSIDDFGTGYSSLAYLKRFPICKLKVDKSFIRDVDSDPQDAAIAKSIIDLAHNMSLEVIAEGVERIEQSLWLADKGCDQIQGFFYAKPMAEDKLLLWALNPDIACSSQGGVYINKP